ncbi:DUF4391 domain-containing protein [Plantibacter sp. VKM Ac-2880]|uniref:DUF4391 domain-containing protein n=1 Tax=Plantibacter sp. VKM Ac-2880 TaxID=2783827 RepID=UPI00188FCBD1|nr:DUF4391 domain-containing protein [Plantibacter sp. VKM Ac-2880]MBF4570488.1 DUF4391 domain-containing protein [Plantibacter sp. VKM Ac-2880]
MPEPTLYRWPASAEVGKSVPKTKFYERGDVPGALREKFVDDVHRITWAYKLADITIHLAGSGAVPEIQVFTIETKGKDVADDVLAAIDRSIHYPVIFEIAGQERVRMTAAQKSLGGTMPRIGTYLTTGWAPVDSPRDPLPTAIDLVGLYEAIITKLLPLQTRDGESVSAATGRMNEAHKLRREITALEKRLRAEPQLNRKIDLRRQLKDREARLAELTAHAPNTRG